MTALRLSLVCAIAAVVAVVPAVGCGGADVDSQRRGGQVSGSPDSPDAADTTPTTGFPFEPVPPTVYVAKVKNLVVGLAPTEEEVAAVVNDPNALRGLLDTWMTLPQFEAKTIDFFRNAFQQNHVSLAQFTQSLLPFDSDFPITISSKVRARLEQALMDSFALTAWQLVLEGRPLNEAITTRRYMLNPPLMMLLSLIDEYGIYDNPNSFVDRLVARKPITSYSFDFDGPATLAETLNPQSPNYMVWKIPVARPQGCGDGRVSHNANDNYSFLRLERFLYGHAAGQGADLPCKLTGEIPSQFSDADWSDWRMVTIHPTDGSVPNSTPIFFDVLKMRSAKEMWLHIPRIGFMGSMAFQTNWQTNLGNSARVTANQSLIVALGASINGTGAPPSNVNSSAVDSKHAGDAQCAACHVQLDPFRQFFRQSYSVVYREQVDTTQLSIPAAFNLYGVSATGQGVGDVANILANHPRFALAWVQKLHFWANTLPALEDDPEFMRIAAAFQASHFDFKTLVRELFSSPLITYAGPTETTRKQGVLISISRRDHYCTALSNRLGLPDVCGMAQAFPSENQASIGQLAALIPVDTYYRAAALPSLSTDPNMFFRASVEKMCLSIADQIIDVKGGGGRYDSTKPDEAMEDFVSTVMALTPSDPRAAPTRDILKENFDQTKAEGASASEALKSTFAVACVGPSSVMVGQ